MRLRRHPQRKRRRAAEEAIDDRGRQKRAVAPVLLVRADTRVLGGDVGLDAGKGARRPVVMVLATLVGVHHLRLLVGGRMSTLLDLVGNQRLVHHVDVLGTFLRARNREGPIHER